jgi:hypothetical protein
MDRSRKLEELDRLRHEVERLEQELAPEGAVEEDGLGDNVWPPRHYYTAFHFLAGLHLGMIGAAMSLLFNIIGSLLVGQHPLQLIRIYLTFPLGPAAATTENGLTLAIGCCLYLGTGMFLGVPFQMVLSRWFDRAGFGRRFLVVTAMSLALWVINFYVLLSWLQPLLFGGAWIVEQIPWWVAALTHLVFGWTMLLVEPLGQFVPYHANREMS